MQNRKGKGHPYFFIKPEHGETLDDKTAFRSAWDGTQDFHAAWIAEDAAARYHDFCDGWEASWPVVFELYDQEEWCLGRFSVERETVPEFHAARINPR